MSISGISFGGIASGLDTGAIIQALLAVEERPINLLRAQRSGFQNERSLFSDLETRLRQLLDAADALNDTTSFTTLTASSTTPGVATASVATGASAGIHQVTVTTLAAGQISESAQYSSNSSVVVTGAAGAKLSFTVGANTVDVALTGSYSLDDLATEINAASAGVTASVVQVASGSYELVVRGADGAANAFTVVGSGTPNVTDLGLALNTNIAQAATDAALTVDGVAVSSSSNSIANALPGVTLNLVSTGSTTITVDTDDEAIADRVQSLVDAYNSVVDFLETQAAFDPATNSASSPLFGDSTLRTIRSTLRNIAGSSVSTSNAAYDSLAQVGIDTDQDGRLSMDRTAFLAAMATDATAVTELFTDTSAGIAARLYATTDGYLDTVDGIIKARQDGYDDRIATTDEQIRRAEDRLEALETSLVERFGRLETLLGQLQAQGNALAALNLPTQ